MSTTSTQSECYLLIHDQPISVHHFLLKDYSMTSPLVITLLIHCELSQCALLKLGETVRLVIKKGTDAMSIELVMTQKVMKEIVQSQSSAFYKLTLCSPFYLALQACINEVYPNQHAGDFIMTFIRHRIGAFIKYDLALSKHYQPKHRVAKQCSGYHFFRDTLLEEGIYFVSKIIEGKESLYFTDDLTRQLNDKVHQNLPYQRLEEQAKIGENRAIKQSILVETNHLNCWPGEHVHLNGARHRIETISIEGWQSNHPLGVTGDFPTLKTSISLVPIDTPCHMVPSPKRSVLFQSARIHSTQKNGSYGILYDFLPRAAGDQIVYKVKKNVSLTGKHISCDMGLYPNTQVVLSIPYRELASPIILEPLMFWMKEIN